MFVQIREYIDGGGVGERSSWCHAPAFVQSHCNAHFHVPFPATEERALVEHEVAFVVFEQQKRTQWASLCVRQMCGGPLRVAADEHRFGSAARSPSGSKRSAATCHTAHTLREWCPLPARVKVM